MKIRKRMGIPQEFDRSKIQRSMECSGVPTSIASMIAAEVKPKEDMSTEEIRKYVVNRLKQENPAYAASYESTRRLNIRGSAYVSKGVCRINEDFMSRMGLEPGQNVMLMSGDSRIDLRAESVPSLSSREVLVNDTDLNALRAPPGARIELKMQ